MPTRILCSCKISPAGIVVEPVVSAFGLNLGDGPPGLCRLTGCARASSPIREAEAPPTGRGPATLLSEPGEPLLPPSWERTQRPPDGQNEPQDGQHKAQDGQDKAQDGQDEVRDGQDDLGTKGPFEPCNV